MSGGIDGGREDDRRGLAERRACLRLRRTGLLEVVDAQCDRQVICPVVLGHLGAGREGGRRRCIRGDELLHPFEDRRAGWAVARRSPLELDRRRDVLGVRSRSAERQRDPDPETSNPPASTAPRRHWAGSLTKNPERSGVPAGELGAVLLHEPVVLGLVLNRHLAG